MRSLATIIGGRTDIPGIVSVVVVGVVVLVVVMVKVIGEVIIIVIIIVCCDAAGLWLSVCCSLEENSKEVLFENN